MIKKQYRIKVLKWGLLLVLLTSVGCSQNSFQSSALDNVNKSLNTPGTIKSCEAPVSKYKLNTEIVALRVTSRNRVTFGFDIAKGLFDFFKISFKAISGEFSLVMDIRDSLDEKRQLAHGRGASKMSKREFRFNFGFKEFGVGFENFSERTPLAELTRRSLEKALNDITEDFKEKAEPWSTSVQDVIENAEYNEVIISAGKGSNLKKGDVLAFYNTEQRWSGIPCESDYIFTRRTSKEPIAYGTVLLIRNSAAQLELKMVEGVKESIKIGAEGVVHQLNEEGRELRQAITISNIRDFDLDFDNEKINLSPHLIKQISGIAADKGFVIYRE